MKSLRKVAFFINISRSTVHRWISYESNERKTRVSMIKPIVLQSIEAYVKTHPFATILETRKVVSEEFKINPSKELVRLALKKCGFTRKRARQFSQPNNLEEKINSFIQERDVYIKENRTIVSIDETSFGRNVLPPIGYSKKGERLRVKRPKVYIKTQSVLACISNTDSNVIYEQRSGSYDAVAFTNFLRKLTYKPGTVFLLDNVRFHHTRFVKDLAEKRQWILLYTPPYSPVFNPIEGVFSIVKRHYYKFLDINRSFDQVTARHIGAFLKHSLSVISSNSE
jgi:transposase